MKGACGAWREGSAAVARWQARGGCGAGRQAGRQASPRSARGPVLQLCPLLAAAQHARHQQQGPIAAHVPRLQVTHLVAATRPAHPDLVTQHGPKGFGECFKVPILVSIPNQGVKGA